MFKSDIESKQTNITDYQSGNARGGLVVNVSASHVVGREIVHRPGHTLDNSENGTNCLPPWNAGITVDVWQCNPTVCGTVYGDMR